MLGGALEARRGRGEHTAKGARAGCKMRLQEDDFPLQLRRLFCFWDVCLAVTSCKSPT